MALQMILDLGSTSGESKLSGHEDKIDIDQYSIDYHQSGTFHRGGGGFAAQQHRRPRTSIAGSVAPRMCDILARPQVS